MEDEKKREGEREGGRERKRGIETEPTVVQLLLWPDVTIVTTRKNNLKAENNTRSLD